jgi:hypothetical protein
MALTFGIEIELDAPRERVAQLIGRLIGGQVQQVDPEDYAIGEMPSQWGVVRDETILADEGCQTEVVSPPLAITDLAVVKTVLSELQRMGGRTNASCGIHVHVGSIPPSDFRAIVILVGMMEYIEPRFYLEFDVSNERREQFARPLDPKLVERIRRAASSGSIEEAIETLRLAWYGERGSERSKDRYDPSRYHGLNIHSWLYRGTVEFRYFNSTLDPKMVERYVQASMAIVEESLAILKLERALSGSD